MTCPWGCMALALPLSACSPPSALPLQPMRMVRLLTTLAEMQKWPDFRPKFALAQTALDSLGNTTAATGKGFAIGSAALTAMALLAAYIEEVKMWVGKLAGEGTFMGMSAHTAEQSGIMDFVNLYDLHIMNPLLICGLFLGSMMAFVFCAMTMKAVGRAAGAMVNEVRRQFRDIPGIMEGTATPEYAKCVAISTTGAQREMIVPSLLAIIIPVVTGLVMVCGRCSRIACRRVGHRIRAGHDAEQCRRCLG